MAKKTAQAAYQELLRDFRQKYIPELDKNIEVWKKIRDGEIEGATARDRNEAAKNIQRALGAMTTEKSAPQKEDKKETSPFSKQQEKRITKSVNEVLAEFDKEN